MSLFAVSATGVAVPNSEQERGWKKVTESRWRGEECDRAYKLLTEKIMKEVKLIGVDRGRNTV